ncbi:hypothetical protein [Enterococcus gallinarum]|uniref:hypothetical protein n=1 Tax=Enterococcus gallinarum TaxID=1353 RepID=UPI000BBC62B7|nr:hypothetical protein [Enterococcus gallinarum]PCD90764.1 hypothetical protein CKY18_16095 [Enterococcus gallinarum]
MNKQIYTITELSEKLNQAKQNVRRRLIKLDIKAINRDDREYKTDPLEYDYQALIKLAEDYGVILRTSDSSTKEQAKEQAKDDIIDLLKEQLEYEKDRNEKLSKLNDNLLEQLDKNQTLLDQQQRLSLNDQNSIKMLESELEEKKEEKEEKETKWYHVFQRKK